MSLIVEKIQLTAIGFSGITNITEHLKAMLSKNNIQDGILIATTTNSEAALISVNKKVDIQGYLKPLIQDLTSAQNYNNPLTPTLKANLVGKSVTIPFSKKFLTMTPMEQVILIDFSQTPKPFELILQILY